MSDKNIIMLIFGLIAFILFINILKFILNFFSNRRRYVEAYDIRNEVHTKIRPRLGSLEQKFQKESEGEEEFGKYVYRLFKDDFKDKNQKIVEKEICKCCTAYENAECKEDFCLEGACKK